LAKERNKRELTTSGDFLWLLCLGLGLISDPELAQSDWGLLQYEPAASELVIISKCGGDGAVSQCLRRGSLRRVANMRVDKASEPHRWSLGHDKGRCTWLDEVSGP